jgi:hypothetical protein
MADRRPPHPATLPRSATVQPKVERGERPPHPATIQRRDAGRPPHPATIQRRDAGRPPHPATVMQRSPTPGAQLTQRRHPGTLPRPPFGAAQRSTMVAAPTHTGSGNSGNQSSKNDDKKKDDGKKGDKPPQNHKATKEELAEVCSICLAENPDTKMMCGHLFHFRPCLEQLMDNNIHRCPICRRPMQDWYNLEDGTWVYPG